ncbi:hypothetical protein HID58_067182 [Brassica napus]|uniref:Uncharacterized protein n=1 Tax=Brassica napus TaxID=3708 RepID=A0ABQ7ZI61_BRANA|nr:hypothetical protein HID58_067182 [Brassica napus]
MESFDQSSQMRLSFRGSECEEELHSRELSSSMLGKKTMKKNGFATHLTGSNGLNRILSYSLLNCFLQFFLSFCSLMAQHERTDICGLKEENDRIRCENIAIRESLKHTICPTCCDTPVHEDSYFDEQKLRLKRHSLEKSSRGLQALQPNHGRPLSPLPPLLTDAHFSIRVTTQWSFGPLLDFNLLPGSCSSMTPNLVISDMSKLHSFFLQSLQNLKLLKWFHLDCVEITEMTYV